MSYYNNASYRRYGINVESPYFKTLNELEIVINILKKNIETDGFATLEDYYKLTKGSTIEGDSAYGWTDLLNITIESTRYGYVLRIPVPQRLHLNPINEVISSLESADEDSIYDVVQDACDTLRNFNK